MRRPSPRCAGSALSSVPRAVGNTVASTVAATGRATLPSAQQCTGQVWFYAVRVYGLGRLARCLPSAAAAHRTRHGVVWGVLGPQGDVSAVLHFLPVRVQSGVKVAVLRSKDQDASAASPAEDQLDAPRSD